jgi:hypothetical protein
MDKNGSPDNEVQVSNIIEILLSTCCGQNICLVRVLMHLKSTYTQFLFNSATSQLCATKDFLGSLCAMWDILVTKAGLQVLDQATKGLLVNELECLV